VPVPVHRACVAVTYLQKYEYFAGEMYISMSADATCRGLRSPTDGPLTMQLRKGQLCKPFNYYRILYGLYAANICTCYY